MSKYTKDSWQSCACPLNWVGDFPHCLAPWHVSRCVAALAFGLPRPGDACPAMGSSTGVDSIRSFKKKGDRKDDMLACWHKSRRIWVLQILKCHDLWFYMILWCHDWLICGGSVFFCACGRHPRISCYSAKVDKPIYPNICQPMSIFFFSLSLSLSLSFSVSLFVFIIL